MDCDGHGQVILPSLHVFAMLYNKRFSISLSQCQNTTNSCTCDSRIRGPAPATIGLANPAVLVSLVSIAKPRPSLAAANRMFCFDTHSPIPSAPLTFFLHLPLSFFLDFINHANRFCSEGVCVCPEGYKNPPACDTPINPKPTNPDGGGNGGAIAAGVIIPLLALGGAGGWLFYRRRRGQPFLCKRKTDFMKQVEGTSRPSKTSGGYGTL